MLDTDKTLGEATKRVSEETSITIEDYATMVAESYSKKRVIDELQALIEERSRS